MGSLIPMVWINANSIPAYPPFSHMRVADFLQLIPSYQKKSLLLLRRVYLVQSAHCLLLKFSGVLHPPLLILIRQNFMEEMCISWCGMQHERLCITPMKYLAISSPLTGGHNCAFGPKANFLQVISDSIFRFSFGFVLINSTVIPSVYRKVIREVWLNS